MTTTILNPFNVFEMGPIAQAEFTQSMLRWLEDTGVVKHLGFDPGDTKATLFNEPTTVRERVDKDLWFDSWQASLVGGLRAAIHDEWLSKLSPEDLETYRKRAERALVADTTRWGSE